MNDAREFMHALDVVRGQLQRLARAADRQPSDELFFRVCEETLTDFRKNHVHAFCLSEHPDQLSQWRAYSRGGGYALGFDAERLAHLMRQHGFTLARCIYHEAEQLASVRGPLEAALTVFRDYIGRGEGMLGSMQAARDVFFPDFASAGPFMNDSAFMEEAEWRLVSTRSVADDPRIDFRSASNSIAPTSSLPA
jgi:hypothetical protein